MSLCPSSMTFKIVRATVAAQRSQLPFQPNGARFSIGIRSASESGSRHSGARGWRRERIRRDPGTKLRE
jgi:hypothetical protein